MKTETDEEIAERERQDALRMKWWDHCVLLKPDEPTPSYKEYAEEFLADEPGALPVYKYRP